MGQMTNPLASFPLKIICFKKSSNTGPPFQILLCGIILLQPELLLSAWLAIQTSLKLISESQDNKVATDNGEIVSLNTQCKWGFAQMCSELLLSKLIDIKTFG